jgi:nucleotide-binding universal stress UspA family protein
MRSLPEDVMIWMCAQNTEQRRATGLVMVGVDGSDASVDALRWAVDEAARRDARLEAVYVYALPSEAGWYVGGHPTVIPPEKEAVIASAKSELDRAVTRGVGDATGTPLATVVVADSSPARGLARAARHADLLVVGAHHVSGLGRLFGSTTAGLLRHAECPVVVVPESQGVRSSELNETLVQI